MSSVFVSLVITGVWVAVQGPVGHQLTRKGKPYSAVITGVHGLISLFVLAGLVSTMFKLKAVAHAGVFSLVSLHLAALGVLAALVTGIILTVVKGNTPNLAIVHKVSMAFTIVFLIAAAVFLAIKI